jgi:parvulin-like peptidyl-prolyl isomerase
MGRWISRGVALLIAFAPACTANEKGAAVAGTPTASVPAPGVAAEKPLPDPLPRVAASVNGQEIPAVRVKMFAEGILAKNPLTAKEEKARTYRRVVEQFVNRELLFQEALARKLTADTKAVEAAENQARAKYKTEKEWIDHLGAEGMDVEYYRAELRMQLTVNAIAQQELAKIPPVVDADLQKYYEEHPEQFTRANRVRVAQILVRTSEDLPVEARKGLRIKAESLVAKARVPGADFAQLAKEFSDERISAPKGGVLDVFGKGEMPPELAPFEQAAMALEPGGVSDVVETKAGFHVIKMLEQLGDEKAPLDPLKDSLRHYLLQSRHTEAMNALVQSLRAKAKIETFL